MLLNILVYYTFIFLPPLNFRGSKVTVCLDWSVNDKLNKGLPEAAMPVP